MRVQFQKYLLSIAFSIFLGLQGAVASSDVTDRIAEALYAGKTADAVSIATTHLEGTSDDAEARFALGIAQFLQSVENLGQQLHRYGLESLYRDQTGLTGLPILRLPVPHNDDPEALSYDGFRDVLKGFIRDLQQAETTLAGVGEREIDISLDLGRIRLDMNGDASLTDDEYLWIIFQSVANIRGLDSQRATGFIVDLDSSDVPWLQAYCHVLMGIAEFPLAHDWQAVFDATFFNVFANIETSHSELAEADADALAELQRLYRDGIPVRPQRSRNTETWDEYWQRLGEWEQTDEGRIYARVRSLESSLLVSQIADLIAFIHLGSWPVVEPERMTNVLTHLETVVSLSRENWRRILAETDDRREWIPNTKQTGIIPGVRVSQDQVDGWHLFLVEFEAVLKGDKLLPHWRFDKGINLRRVFTEPRTFDLVMFGQGAAAVPYLEDGELVNQDTWWHINNLLGGNVLRYFVWFN